MRESNIKERREEDNLNFGYIEFPVPTEYLGNLVELGLNKKVRTKDPVLRNQVWAGGIGMIGKICDSGGKFRASTQGPCRASSQKVVQGE